MGLKVAEQHRPALLATIVGAGVVAAGSMVAILVKSWFKRPRVPITILSGFLGAGKVRVLDQMFLFSLPIFLNARLGVCEPRQLTVNVLEEMCHGFKTIAL